MHNFHHTSKQTTDTESHLIIFDQSENPIAQVLLQSTPKQLILFLPKNSVNNIELTFNPELKAWFKQSIKKLSNRETVLLAELIGYLRVQFPAHEIVDYQEPNYRIGEQPANPKDGLKRRFLIYDPIYNFTCYEILIDNKNILHRIEVISVIDSIEVKIIFSVFSIKKPGVLPIETWENPDFDCTLINPTDTPPEKTKRDVVLLEIVNHEIPVILEFLRGYGITTVENNGKDRPPQKQNSHGTQPPNLKKLVALVNAEQKATAQSKQEKSDAKYAAALKKEIEDSNNKFLQLTAEINKKLNPKITETINKINGCATNSDTAAEKFKIDALNLLSLFENKLNSFVKNNKKFSEKQTVEIQATQNELTQHKTFINAAIDAYTKKTALQNERSALAAEINEKLNFEVMKAIDKINNCSPLEKWPTPQSNSSKKSPLPGSESPLLKSGIFRGSNSDDEMESPELSALRNKTPLPSDIDWSEEVPRRACHPNA